MAIGDLPAISSGSYASKTMAIGALSDGGWGTAIGKQFVTAVTVPGAEKIRRIQQFDLRNNLNEVVQQMKEAIVTTRIVQVYIADPNENVPLEARILYTGEQKATDSTDQELFFEIDMKTILASHNEKRIKFVDKKVKDRTEYLEPVKIRDLKMTVVTIAQF